MPKPSYSEDVDIAAPPNIIAQIWEAILNGATNFNIEADGQLAFDSPQGFIVRLDLIEIGAGFINRVVTAIPFLGGSLASKPDLLRLRALSAVDRGDFGELEDFKWLLYELAIGGILLPELDSAKRSAVIAIAAQLGPFSRLVLVAILGMDNSDAGLSILEL
ncbi:hypothetical protein E4U43_005243 [Claviceps pusilla]|uniref:Uncharacterized protein n=1 Tax=Claviceps pusilla TaxID=123648 RepID=A0A9P7N2B3_9HYPO|nr:hypothetical protein E4U43_005243 [Claviceps pusilla]